MFVRIRMFVTAMFGTSLAVVLMLLLMGCAVDTASQQGESIGNTQQLWQASWQQVAGTTFVPQSNSVVTTFVDNSGVHMVGTSTGNRVWYKRVATDGVTVVVPWAQVPGQGLFFGTQYTPIIVRGTQVLRSRQPYIVFRVITGGDVEYTTLNHYFVGNTWSWTGTWTTVPTIPNGVLRPVAGTYLNGNNRIYLFYIGVTDYQPYVTYSDNNASTWTGPYLIGGGQANDLAAVDHHTDANNHYIELVRRNRLNGYHSWNRLLDPAALDSPDWRGWQTIPGDVSSSADIGLLVQKTYNFCISVTDENNFRPYENCTTYGSGGDSSTFAATWTQILPAFDAYWGVNATSYCTSNDSVPDLCPNGNTKKYDYVTQNGTPPAGYQYVQWELK